MVAGDPLGYRCEPERRLPARGFQEVQRRALGLPHGSDRRVQGLLEVTGLARAGQ
jgi:hypothetical protein